MHDTTTAPATRRRAGWTMAAAIAIAAATCCGLNLALAAEVKPGAEALRTLSVLGLGWAGFIVALSLAWSAVGLYKGGSSE